MSRLHSLGDRLLKWLYEESGEKTKIFYQIRGSIRVLTKHETLNQRLVIETFKKLAKEKYIRLFPGKELDIYGYVAPKPKGLRYAAKL